MMKKRYSLDPENSKQAEQIESALLENLEPILPDSQQRARIHQRLFEKVSNSLANESARITIRHSEGHWHTIRPGVRAKALSRDKRTFLLELACGATLPMHRHHEDEECVVLRGTAQLGSLMVHEGDYHLALAGSRHGKISSETGALLYLRGIPIGHTTEVTRDLLTAYLPGKGRDHVTVRSNEGEWSSIVAGVQYKTLYNDETSYSSMIRMTSDAVLESQQKILADDEEFLLLKGDMFIGDTLMQAGDWQFAPKGTKHLPLTTSKEAVLFVRSAQDILSSST